MTVSKITYLLGAGASAGALPTVVNLPERLILFYKKIADQRNFKDVPDKSRDHIRLLQAKTWEVLQALVQNTEKWGENFTGFTEGDSKKILVKHASVDTYAKRLFITKDEKLLNDLKIVLTAFFEYEQNVRHVDIRYDHFLASIIADHSKIFPDNVRVLTWNYDRQFELAYKPYQGASAGLKVISKGLVKPTQGKNQEFEIIRLNGIATCVDFERHEIANTEANNAFTRVAEVASDLLSHGLQSGISFAWEADQGAIVRRAKETIQETDILIVIGYSFPFFNRQIDREILKGIDLTTLYIQDFSPQGVKERFMALYGTAKFTTVAIETGQFFIPNEFD